MDVRVQASSERKPTAACPLCGAGGAPLFSRSGYWIYACSRCRHRYATVEQRDDHVTNNYGDEYFFGGGAGFPNYLQDAEILRQHGRRYAAIVEQHRPPGRLLDVGAAAGFLLEGFHQRGWEAVAIEPNATMAQSLRERLGCEVHAQTLETFRSAEHFDLVMMIQVVTHFVDVADALAAAAAVTRPGGFWLIETWNRASSTARVFGRYWHEYSPPTVLHWFTPASLAELVARFGFRVVGGGRASKRISAAHAKSLLRYRLEGTAMERLLPLVAAVPDRWALPYPGDDLFWTLFQRDGATEGRA